MVEKDSKERTKKMFRQIDLKKKKKNVITMFRI